MDENKEIELIEKRGPREKHFLQKDGTIKAIVYSDNVHYLKDGKYEEIDNTLIKQDNCYVNKNNSFKVKFSENGENSLMKIEEQEDYLDIKIKESNTSKINFRQSLSKSISDVSYSNILDGIDIEYKVLPTKVKETIVLPNNRVKKLSFLVNTNLELEMFNGSILAKNKSGKTFIVEKPYMMDSKGNICTDISYELKKVLNSYEIELILNSIWLDSKDTTYPVYVDPTITNSSGDSSVFDTYIYPGDNGADKNGQDILKAGVEKVNGVDRINRTLIKFDLPKIGTGSEIVNASLSLIGYPTVSGDNFEQMVEIHRITEPWEEDKATWDQMNDKYDEKVESVQFAMRSTVSDNLVNPYSSYYNDLTNLVKKWYRDTPNYGILIKSTAEEYFGDNYPAFFSKNNTVQGENPKPVLAITYRNQNGLENYLNYITQSFTDGTTYMNTFNGNLVGVFGIGATIGGKLPVSLNLVYNTNDVILKQNGFQFSLAQTLKEIDIEGNQYLEFNDEDGTIHYFYKDTEGNSELFRDEDGLSFSVVKENSNYIMSDKYGNKKTFIQRGDTYYLTQIEDISNNKIQIEFDSNNRIIKAVDANSAEITIIYNDGNTVIISPDSSVTVNYLGNNVTSIITNNGITNFEYNDKNLISCITDVNGLKISYDYCSELPYRMKKITQYGIDNELGNYFQVDYGFNFTTIIDSKGRVNNLIFTNSGTLASNNNMSSIENIDDSYSTESLCGGYFTSENYSTIPNKKLYDSIPIKYVKNYLKNSSFETDTDIFEFKGGGITTEFSTDCAVSGNRSLKVTNPSGTASIETGTLYMNYDKYYTFSGYFKNDQKMKIAIIGTRYLPHPHHSTDLVQTFEEFESSDEFVRREVTFFGGNSSYDGSATILITFEGPGTCYIDDIQFEEGEVANNYNILENSDFRSGYSDWDVQVHKRDYHSVSGDRADFVEVSPDEVLKVVKINDSQHTALKFNFNPLLVCQLRKTFPLKGKKGDMCDISFWIKFDGLVGNSEGDTQPSPLPHVENNAFIAFKPIGYDYGSCIFGLDDFTPNEKWQHISCKYIAEEDFEEVMISFYSIAQANTMYLTNLSFYRQLSTTYYHYDKNGNLTSMDDVVMDRNTVFNYDKNNQLISATNPKGKHFSYEYDNVKSDQVLSAISAMGISNQVKYDSFGNPIVTKVSKKATSELDSGKYKIRNKGTDVYLKAEYNTVLVESDSCSNTVWDLEKIEEEEVIEREDEWDHSITTETIIHQYFKIIYSMIPDFTLQYLNNTILLTNENTNNLFVLEEVGNGSYYIKLKDAQQYLKVNNGVLEIADFVNDDPSLEFYFEVVDSKFIENTATYTEDGRFVKSVTDSLFRTTSYETDSTTGLLISTTNAKNQTTNYTYSNKKQITSISQGNRVINYIYNNQNLIDKIVQDDRKYNFTYDKFLNIKQVIVGNDIILITNQYGDNNGNLLKSTYGNGQEISYEYDGFDRIQSIHKMDKDYFYRYDSNGNLAKILSNDIISTIDTDPENIKNYDHTIKYYYDKAKRICEYANDNFTILYNYDSNNNVISKKYQIDAINHSLENVFDKDDNIVKSVLDNQEFNYVYDELGRLQSSDINNQYHTNYDYVSYGKRTSTLINSITIGNNQYSYKYDELNNITDVYCNNELINKYFYDEYNELIEEENYTTKKKIMYTYDNLGNILTKTETNLDTSAIIKTDTYQYSNTNWKDQLTNYNDSNITYDEIGNPITIGNNIKLNWINGRSLYNYSDSSKNLDISYQYNADGIRISKVVNGIETRYHLENNNIIYEQRENDTIYYLYNLTGLIGFKYNNDVYYYIRNVQDDIIGILDSNYNQIVTYEYDSWGKILSIKDENGNDITDSTNIGIINPFRYRSYYYDSETTLYYLNSRYYNSEWARFLNADRVIGANKDMFGYNLYAYVSNNPIVHSDLDGHGLFSKIKTVVKNFLKLNKEEKQKVVSKPVSAYRAMKIARKITAQGKKIYGNDIIDIDSGTANGYKHTMWNAAMTYEMGSKTAKQFADAHEYGQTGAATDMDLANNELGRQIGNIYKENEKLMLKNRNCTFALVYACENSIQKFDYLGKTFTITDTTDPYEVMSNMVQHAIDQGVVTILIP